MRNIFKRENKEIKKQYRVTKGFNIWTGEYEEINLITDKLGLSNLVVNGFEELEVEEIK